LFRLLFDHLLDAALEEAQCERELRIEFKNLVFYFQRARNVLPFWWPKA